MIAFLQPLALLGLAGAAIPALLHLLQRREPPTVIFPAVRYLTQTEREQSRRLKLRNLLLLILRTLIIIFVVIAAARPVARIAVGAVHAPTAIAVVVDNSLSSGVVRGGHRLLDELVQQAKRVVERVSESDHLWLVVADGVPRRIPRLEASAVLDSLTPWPVRLDLSDAVRISSRSLADDPLPGREVVILSDLQATAFSPGDPPPSDVRVLAARPPALPANRGLDSARAEPAVWRPEGNVIGSVGGAGTGPSAVRVTLGETDVAQAVAAPGQRVGIHVSGQRRGWYAASIRLDPDELRADDQWRLALRVADPAAARAGPGAGQFVREGLTVLQQSGRVGTGDAVRLDDELTQGRSVVFPPADPVLLGAVNRALAARGVGWRFGELLTGEWQLDGEVGVAAHAPVFRRHRLSGTGTVVARVGGEPWIVRDRDVVVVASRMDETWTGLPLSAGFVPFLDVLVNGLATSGSSVVRATPGAVVELPGGASRLDLPGTPLQIPPDRRVAAPLESGVYFLLDAAGDTLGALEVNHDSRESMLQPADRRALRASLGDLDLVDADDLDSELFRGARRADLGALFLAAAVLTALVELAVATAGGRFTRGP